MSLIKHGLGNSQQQQAMGRYYAWQQLEERAKQNAKGGELPEGYTPIHRSPPPPLPIDDADILDLSMELNATTIDDNLDEHGIERIPMADPGLDVSHHLGLGFELLLIDV